MIFQILIPFWVFWCMVALGAPVNTSTEETESELLKRQGQNNPIDVTINISGWPNQAEENCFAMLCLQAGNRVLQRVLTRGAVNDNRQESGVNLGPFKRNLARRGTDQINTGTTSAEEYPWACTTDGGSKAYLFPGTVAEQSSQGGSIQQAYNKYNVRNGDYFKVTFSPASSFGKYCTALHANPPDMSICSSQPTESFWGTVVNIANYAYRINKSSRYYVFDHVAGKMAGKSGQLRKRQEGDDVNARYADEEAEVDDKDYSGFC